MKTEKLEQSYRNHLVKVGVHPQRAEEAAKSLTSEQLQMIREIWPEWAAYLSQIEVKYQHV